MPYVPQEVIEHLKEHPSSTGMDLFLKGLAGSPRTGNRYKQYIKAGVADSACRQKRVLSQQMADLWEDESFNLEQFLERAPQLVREAQRRDPVITHDVLDFDTDQPVAVIFPSCAHLGGRYTAYEEFKDIFHQVLGMDRIYWGSLGDDIEGFETFFRDVDAIYSQIVNVKVQYQILERILDELAEQHKLLFGMSSQHGGDWTQRNTGTNPIKDLYLKYGVPFFDGQAYVKFVVGDQTYNVAMAHAFKGHSQWNPLHPQTRAWKFEFPQADLVVMGDRHTFGWSEVPGYGWEEDSPKTVLLLQSGTMKTGPDKYTIQKFSQGQLGWPIVVFFPHEHKLKWSWELEDIKYWLGEEREKHLKGTEQ